MRIERVDYLAPRDARALVMLLDAYALDPMGGGQGLSDKVKARLCADLAQRPGAASFIAWLGTGASAQPIGLINCLEGYSTFKAQPLLNIHDIAVLPAHRGLGVWAAEQFDRIPTEPFDTVFDSPLLFVEFVS